MSEEAERLDTRQCWVGHRGRRGVRYGGGVDSSSLARPGASPAPVRMTEEETGKSSPRCRLLYSRRCCVSLSLDTLSSTESVHHSEVRSERGRGRVRCDRQTSAVDGAASGIELAEESYSGAPAGRMINVRLRGLRSADNGQGTPTGREGWNGKTVVTRPHCERDGARGKLGRHSRRIMHPSNESGS
ncbi:unnamed protein product [Lota lota]